MNEKKNVDNNEKGKNTKKGAARESGSKGKEGKKEAKSNSKADETFVKPPKINMSNIDTGAIYAGLKSLFKNANKLDAQVTNYAGELYLRVKNYFIKSIDSYKE